MRLLLALLLLPAIGACTPPRPAANAHPPLMPDNPANGATPAAPPRSSATPAIAGLSPSAVAMSWMLGDWMCEVVSQGGGATQEAHVRGRLIVDTYMDVWLGAGFEPEALTAGVAKGDFYFTYDAGARAWTLVGFMSDGSHYTMSSPGELDGSMEWSGSLLKSGAATELRATWTHQAETTLEMHVNRRAAGGWVTSRWACRR